MSSNEEDYNDKDQDSQSLKKRRIQRACDICRRKKIRCDGVQMPGNRCSNCVAYNFDCTYVEAAKKRGPPKGYVENLETRLEKLEKLLRRLCPDDSLLRELDSSLDLSNPTPSASASAFVKDLPPGDPRSAATSALRNLDDSLGEEDNAHLLLADNLKQLSIDPVDYRFFGKSSGAMLIQTAIELKNEYTGVEQESALMPGVKRDEFWAPHPWERITSRHKRAHYTFPEPDLIASLTDLYFRNLNLYLPLLHRPTFERLISENFHLRNDSFASTVLLVCAVGSRFSDDPRVLLDGEESSHSAGWKWFDQVQMVKKSLLAPPSLYDLQFYVLSVQFLQGSSAPQSCWTMVGIGIRLAQDVGAHRRKVQRGNMTVDDELWKRAFWVLVCMDRMVSAALGRPCAIQDEDFDLDMPIECDDEYWEHPIPEQRWRQPAGKPSLVTAFNLMLKLNQVLAFSLRTIYSINKSKILLGFVGSQWEQHIVAELDSALNKWVDSVPDHLRWDPNREDFAFFNQSVVLYSLYYHIQILIHRPFIPSPSKPSPLSFPSLAICTNAARSCCHVVDTQMRHNPTPPAFIQMPVFTSGIVLLLSIWGGKRSGLSMDPNKEMADVHKCMRVLRTIERRWHSAGRLWDILYELASVGDLPLPQPSPTSVQKREREGDTPTSSPRVKEEAPLPEGPRPIAGSKRVTQRAITGTVASPIQVQDGDPDAQALTVPTKSPDSVRSQQPQQQFFSLPVYSEELGRLPLHGQIEFSSPSQQPAGQQPQQYWYGGGNAQPSSSNPSINVSVNVSVGAHSPQVHRRSIDGVQQFETQSLPGALSSPGSNAYAMESPVAPTATFSQLDQSVMYAGGGRGNAHPAARPSSSHPIAPTSAYLHNAPARGPFSVGGMNSTPLQHQHSSPYQSGMHSPVADMRYVGLDGAVGGGHQGSRGAPVQQPHQDYVDSDTMAMWSNAPTGFELDEWGSYLMNVSELTQGGHIHQDGSRGGPGSGQPPPPQGGPYSHHGHGQMHR